MKLAKFFSFIFAVLGTVLLIASVGLCLLSLNAPVHMAEVPAGAAACSEALREAVNDGDFGGIGAVIYGQPDLGVERLPETAEGELIWDAFQFSLSMEFRGECYATDTGLARDAVITALDIPSVTEKLGQRAHALLTTRVENAEDMAELYDNTNNFREELVAEVMELALEQGLRQDSHTVTREVTLTLVNRDGKWWILPDQALLTALSGGLA